VGNTYLDEKHVHGSKFGPRITAEFLDDSIAHVLRFFGIIAWNLASEVVEVG
jgi:hypothetical protein